MALKMGPRWDKMFFESHAHYDDDSFQLDRDEILKMLPSKGICKVINASSDINSSYASIALANQYPYIYAAVGIHPEQAHQAKQEDLSLLRELTTEKKVVAIGEIGLDYYYNADTKQIQTSLFAQQLSLAKEVQLPVIVHSREAAQETFDVIQQSGVRKGVIHCYSGSAQMALEYTKMGFYIGVGGVITFKNAKKLVETVEALPLERILIETDSPYLAPVPNRGKRNDSTNLLHIVKRISEIKKCTEEEVQNITKMNGETLFFKFSK